MELTRESRLPHHDVRKGKGNRNNSLQTRSIDFISTSFIYFLCIWNMYTCIVVDGPVRLYSNGIPIYNNQLQGLWIRVELQIVTNDGLCWPYIHILCVYIYVYRTWNAYHMCYGDDRWAIKFDAHGKFEWISFHFSWIQMHNFQCQCVLSHIDRWDTYLIILAAATHNNRTSARV